MRGSGASASRRGEAGGAPTGEEDGEDGGRRLLLVATRSSHKLRELRDLVGDLPVDFVSLADLGVPETEEEGRVEVHDTFAENAAAKTRHFHRRTGLPTLADDSGLCVDALGGGPGVRTKRFAPPAMVERWGRDEANNRHLLDRLAGVPEGRRGAHYHCSLAVRTDDEELVVDGEVHGRIATEPRGEGGFGYDPLFVLPEHGRTFAELPAAIKQATSHRAEAVRALLPWLREWAGQGG